MNKLLTWLSSAMPTCLKFIFLPVSYELFMGFFVFLLKGQTREIQARLYPIFHFCLAYNRQRSEKPGNKLYQYP